LGVSSDWGLNALAGGVEGTGLGEGIRKGAGAGRGRKRGRDNGEGDQLKAVIWRAKSL